MRETLCARRNFFRDRNVYWTCFAGVNNIGILPDTRVDRFFREL